MDITHYGHACVQADLHIEHAVVRALFDPGVYSRDFETVRDLDVILITHAHPDHLDVDRLRDLTASNPSAEVVLGADSRAALADRVDGVRNRIHVVSPGDKIKLKNLGIEVVGGDHACIHSALPGSPNIGYILDGGKLLHPGDAFDDVAPGIDVLLLPIGGPWMKIGEGIDYMRTLAPRFAVPIHQAGLAQIHRDMHCGLLRTLAPSGTQVRVLEHAVSQNFD